MTSSSKMSRSVDRTVLLRSLLGLVVIGALASAPRPGRWSIVGPGGGGAQFFPTISPHDPRRVLVACDMTGSYLTEDGGASWRMFNLRGTTRSFEWDPNDRNIIYAVNHGAIFRSRDSGKSWALVYPPPNQVSGVEMGDDHSDETILVEGNPAKRIESMAVAQGNSKRLYAVSGRVLLASEDFGASWRTEKEFAPPVRRIWATRDRLYVASERSIWTNENGVWNEGSPAAAPWNDVSAGPPVIYAISESAGAISEDSGKTWRAFDLPGSGAHLHAVATSLRHPDVAYVSFNGLALEGRNWFGVAKTTNRGHTWQLVWKESATPAANLHDAWITPRFGSSWGGQPLSLGIGPDDPDLCYATDLGRTLRTTDGGKNWEAVYSKRTGDAWTSTGLDVTTSYGVHFDPFDVRRIFITYTDIGAFRSEDGGRSWVSATEGVPRPWVNTTYWMAFDPDVRGRVWAVASGTHDLPRPKMWRRTPVARFRGGVIASEDGGRTWRKSAAGMPETAATHIILDRSSPREARVLYVAAFGKGVYKSSDGGASWSLRNEGIAGDEPFVWRLALDRDGGLYAVIARRSEDGSIGAPGDGALYFSDDAAGHWTRMKLPEGVNGPNSVTVDARDAKRLYLSAWQRKGADGGGIYLSTDAGRSWRRVLDRDQHIYDVTVDPKNPRVLYACGFESSAWRSSDRGQTWSRIKGYNFKWGHRVIPDPADRNLIYITTFGGSVWHGPAAGDASYEDIVGPLAPGR